MGYFPTGDTQAVVFTHNFGQVLAADFAKYGVTTQAATEYNQLQVQFQGAVEAARNETTRTKMAVATKNELKKLIHASTSRIVSIVRGQYGLGAQDYIALGLKPRDVRQTVTAEPIATLILSAKAVGPRQIHVVARDGLTSRRALPVGVKGITFFTATGASAPTTAAGWTLRGSVSRATAAIDVTDVLGEAAGTVWICGFYFNGKGQSGIASEAVAIDLPMARALPSASDVHTTTMRVAA